MGLEQVYEQLITLCNLPKKQVGDLQYSESVRDFMSAVDAVSSLSIEQSKSQNLPPHQLLNLELLKILNGIACGELDKIIELLNYCGCD